MSGALAARTARFHIRSYVRCSPEHAWAHASSPAGVAAELRPYLRMTFPRHVRVLDEATVVVGKRLCRSWLLLGGVLPVEYDDVTIVEFEPGRRFLERSSMMTVRVWEHERVVAADGGATTVTDRLAAAPRIAATTPLVTRIVRALFRHRHRQLCRLLGGFDTVEL